MCDVEYTEASFISEDIANETIDWKTQEGDILISMTGSGPNAPQSLVGRVARVWDNEPEAWINQRVGRLVLKAERAIHQDFLFYLLYSPRSQEYLVANSSGSANQANISGKTIESLPCPKVEYDQSSKIAKVLRDLDQKMLINRQTNQTLEQIAQAIFKSWFVDFEPTRAKIAARKHWQALHQTVECSSPTCNSEELDTTPQNSISLDEAMTQAAMAAIGGKAIDELDDLPAETLQQLRATAALFPDALVDSELGEAPEGWDIQRLEDTIELVYGKALKSTDRVEGIYPVYGSGGLTGSHNEFLVEGPGIVVGRKGTVGALYWEEKSFFPIDTVFYVKCKNNTTLVYTYYLLQTLGLEDMNTDAAVPGLNRNNAYRLEIVKVPDAMIENYSVIVGSIRDVISINNRESTTIELIRDSLLPKLLSGELSTEAIQMELEKIA